MPDYFQINVFLLIINGWATEDTVELLHKIFPILSFEHCKSTILKYVIESKDYTSNWAVADLGGSF
jgi:hypothetical protein